MNFRKEENLTNSAISQPLKIQTINVVALSLIENKLNTPKEEKMEQNLLTDVILNNNNNDSTNNITDSIKSMITDIIDKIDMDKDETKHGDEFNINTNTAEPNLTLKSNSDFIFGDFSSSNTSTDTITNTSSTHNYTICSKNEFMSFKQISNTTLKFNTNENQCIHTESKYSICSLEKNQKKDDGKPVENNMNSIAMTGEIKTINIEEEKKWTEDSMSSAVSTTSENLISPYKTEYININFLQMDKIPETSSKVRIQVDLDNKNMKDNKESVNIVTNVFNVIQKKCHSFSKIYNEHKNSDDTLIGSIFSGFSSCNDEHLENISINKTNHSSLSLTSRSNYYSSTDEKMENTNENCNAALNVLPTTSNMNHLKSTNVIVSDGSYKLKSKGDYDIIDDLKQKILNKSFDVELCDKFHKKVNTTLPNEATIKEIITERENLQKVTCSEESRYFQPFCDNMWGKISTTLDLAIKKLEESLNDKIQNELKTTLNKIEHFINQISLQRVNECRDVNTVEKVESVNEEGLQCNIIQSYAIDKLMYKLSGDGESARCAKTKILEAKHPKILADTFEVLKAYHQPVVGPSQGDSLKVSSEESGVSTESRRRMLFDGPMRFLRENTIVLGSVPAFFLYMLVIYGFIVLVVKV